MPTTLQSISTFLHTQRPMWQFMAEENLFRILTQQYIVDWQILEKLQGTFDVKVRDVMNHSTYGVVITLVVEGGE